MFIIDIIFACFLKLKLRSSIESERLINITTTVISFISPFLVIPLFFYFLNNNHELFYLNIISFVLLSVLLYFIMHKILFRLIKIRFEKILYYSMKIPFIISILFVSILWIVTVFILLLNLKYILGTPS